jgi:protein-disulfide isomerase
VFYVYKDFPIVQLHPQAHIAAEAAECAGEQGKYWEMHHALFGAPSDWDTTEEAARAAFEAYASDLGLDIAQFAACMQQARYRGNVTTNIAEGRHFGLTGTPAFVINGKLLSGAHPVDVFRSVIDRELAAAENAEE